MKNLTEWHRFWAFCKPEWHLQAKPFKIIWHEADSAKRVKNHNLACLEWLRYPVRKFTRLLTQSSDVNKSGTHRLSIVCTTGNLALPGKLSSIFVPLTGSDIHDVLLKQHNTHILVMLLMGSSPNLTFHMLIDFDSDFDSTLGPLSRLRATLTPTPHPWSF